MFKSERECFLQENPGEWLYFDLVPEQYEIRDGKPDYTGKVCVIGASLKEEELNKYSEEANEV